MFDNNIQDTLEVFLTILMYATAVTVMVIAVTLSNKNLDFMADRVDEKQSVELDPAQDIEMRVTEAQKDALTKAEVFNSMMAIDTGKTTVTINGSDIDKNTMDLAQDGDERSRAKILLALQASEKFERSNIYDTGSDGDYLSQVVFTSM